MVATGGVAEEMDGQVRIVALLRAAPAHVGPACTAGTVPGLQDVFVVRPLAPDHLERVASLDRLANAHAAAEQPPRSDGLVGLRVDHGLECSAGNLAIERLLVRILAEAPSGRVGDDQIGALSRQERLGCIVRCQIKADREVVGRVGIGRVTRNLTGRAFQRRPRRARWPQNDLGGGGADEDRERRDRDG